MYKRAAGSTSISEWFRILDRDTGDPLTGLTSASPGMSASYMRKNAAPVTITLSDLTAQIDAFSSGGLIETGISGVYRLDVPDAAYAAGADEVLVDLQVTGGLTAPLVIVLESAGGAASVDVASINGVNVTGPDDLKADVSSINVGSVGGTAVTGPADLKADVSSINVGSVGGTAVTGPADLKADVSSVTVSAGSLTSIANAVLTGNFTTAGTAAKYSIVNGLYAIFNWEVDTRFRVKNNAGTEVWTAAITTDGDLITSQDSEA